MSLLSPFLSSLHFCLDVRVWGAGDIPGQCESSALKAEFCVWQCTLKRLHLCPVNHWAQPRPAPIKCRAFKYLKTYEARSRALSLLILHTVRSFSRGGTGVQINSQTPQISRSRQVVGSWLQIWLRELCHFYITTLPHKVRDINKKLWATS